tara:strand:- start:277 stop:441 length:165 start_codon:yes stop_codon:yes gene_type:complete
VAEAPRRKRKSKPYRPADEDEDEGAEEAAKNPRRSRVSLGDEVEETSTPYNNYL